jgi:hypothetical protein
MACSMHVNMQMLGDALRLDRHGTDEKHWEAIAQHLGALQVAVGKLEEMYRQDTLNTTVQLSPKFAGVSIYFPVYPDFKTSEGHDRKVSYSLQPFTGKLPFYGRCRRVVRK